MSYAVGSIAKQLLTSQNPPRSHETYEAYINTYIQQYQELTDLQVDNTVSSC